MVDLEFANDEGGESDGGDNGDGGDPVGGEPVFFLAFVEDDLQKADADGEHADAPVVDFR